MVINTPYDSNSYHRALGDLFNYNTRKLRVDSQPYEEAWFRGKIS